MNVLALFDTPSIKQYVFGTDSLREMRGASANLDRLNRVHTKQVLTRGLPERAAVKQVYANGGRAQFVLDNADADSVRTACEGVVSYFMQETAGDVKPVYGVAELASEDNYQQAVDSADFELRSRREMAATLGTPSLIPLMAECSSASHLPATGLFRIGGDDPKALSESSRVKEKRGHFSREHGVWAEWMKHLAASGPWPDHNEWDHLRCDNIVDIGARDSRVDDDVGLIYADGNAMGRIVQKLNSAQVCKEFSSILDGSIRSVCFEALDKACTAEIDKVRNASGNEFPRMPADILLLGGDDLLVLLPADRALDFAADVARRFQDLTERAIAGISDSSVKEFFQHLDVPRLTISCGVAIARSKYPFYLLLDLAEELLKNAKRGGTVGLSPTAEPHIDFHIVAGANSFSLKQSRREDYFAESEFVRTLRPLAIDQLERLRDSVQSLRESKFPRSKLHALHEAALLRSPVQAQRIARDIFGRCKSATERNERRALWQAISNLQPDGWFFDRNTFPAFQKDERRLLAIADLVEAMDIL